MNEILQSVPFAVVLLVIGFVFLVKGADAFVEGCSSVAKRFHVPTLIIGMTIVAMGTSLPETAVSITASISGNNALAVSNAVGSNIFNLMVVVGVCAVLTPLAVQVGILKRDFPLSIACAILLLILGAIDMTLGHVDGVVFIVLFAFFILYMIRSARNAGNGAEGEEDELLAEAKEMPVMSVPKSLIYIVAGGVAIALGSDWVVDGATTVASAMGISQTLIGLTVVAFGTSLPELATSIVAAKKKEVDMALGNVIGSNIFNILMVLGIASAVSPVAFLTENVIDIVILIIFSAIVWVLAWTKKELNRKEGILMLILYAAYGRCIIREDGSYYEHPHWFELEKDKWAQVYKTTGTPCGCWMCRGFEYDRKEYKKETLRIIRESME